jgi:hypothetical protein
MRSIEQRKEFSTENYKIPDHFEWAAAAAPLRVILVRTP